MSIRPGWLIELFKSFISIMTFFLLLLSTTESGVLTSLTVLSLKLCQFLFHVFCSC